MPLVVHVLEQHQRQRHVADAGKADQRDRARDGADAAAGRGGEVRGVDHAQQLVRQRHVLEDLVGQARQRFGLRGRHALDARDRGRQRRKVALVAHAPQQEFQRRMAVPRLGGRRDFGRLRPAGQRSVHGTRAVVAGMDIARQRALHDAAQRWHRPRPAPAAPGPRAGCAHGAVRIAFPQQRAAAQQLAQHHAGSEDVHRRHRRLATRGLGRDVARRADDAAGGPIGALAGAADGRNRAPAPAAVVLRDPRRDAEVHHAGTPVAAEQDVRWLQVAVHDAPGRAPRPAHRARPAAASPLRAAASAACRDAPAPGSGLRRTRTPGRVGRHARRPRTPARCSGASGG